MASGWLVATQLLAAALMLALAAALCWLDFRSRATRAFATFLVLWAALTFAFRSDALLSPVDAKALQRAGLVYGLGAELAMVYFAMVYPRPRGLLRTRVGSWAFLVAGSAAIIVVLARPCLALCEAGEVVHVGPLVALVNAPALVAASLALLFAWDGCSRLAGHGRTSLLLVSAGFLSHGVVIPALFVVTWLLRPGAMLEAVTGWAAMSSFLSVLPIVPAVAAVTILWRRSRIDPTMRPTARSHALLLAAGAMFGTLAALAPLVGADQGFAYLVIGLWRLVLPCLIGYGLLRHRLFDIDPYARRAIDRATLAAFFAAAFFIVSEAVASYLGPRIGTFAGILAAGALLFIVAPLERAADRLTARIVGPRGAGDEAARRLDVYAELARRAWQNGTLDAGERRFLDGVRAKLGLSLEECARIESQAFREMTQES